ncbi:MAG: type II toxin-antitoxin system RelE/ParE family toxin [Rhodothermales bacterium]
MAEVRWSPQALRDLDAVGAYLERSSPQYARSLVARLYAAAGALAEFPLMGRQVPETELGHIREIVRDGYRIVYFVGGEVVEVLTVLHGRQDLGKKLRREE